MISAFASDCSSVMVVAKEFQLFQPIGGVGASSDLSVVAGDAAAASPDWRSTASNPRAPAAAIISRRLTPLDTVIPPANAFALGVKERFRPEWLPACPVKDRKSVV